MSSHLLYNDEVELKFSDAAHRYSVDGRHVEGVTTILGRVVAKDGLVSWAANMAVEAMKAGATPEEAKKAHVRKKEAGADTGTIVHKMIEQYIRAPFTPIYDNEEVERAFKAWLEWVEVHQPKFIFSEKVCYSRLYNYAGTCDAAAIIGDKKYLIDWKTAEPRREWKNNRYTGSFTYYPEHFIQIAAYDLAIWEESGEEFDGYMVVYVPKSGELRNFRKHDTEPIREAWQGLLVGSRWLKANA